jgi:hypothetical protein
VPSFKTQLMSLSLRELPFKLLFWSKLLCKIASRENLLLLQFGLDDSPKHCSILLCKLLLYNPGTFSLVDTYFGILKSWVAPSPRTLSTTFPTFNAASSCSPGLYHLNLYMRNYKTMWLTDNRGNGIKFQYPANIQMIKHHNILHGIY